MPGLRGGRRRRSRLLAAECNKAERSKEKSTGRGGSGCVIMVQDNKGTNHQTTFFQLARPRRMNTAARGKRGGTDLARKHHPSEVLHVTRRLDVDDRYVLVLGVGEDLGLGGRKIIVKDRTGQDRIG